MPPTFLKCLQPQGAKANKLPEDAARRAVP
jgi:hypothetical protein